MQVIRQVISCSSPSSSRYISSLLSNVHVLLTSSSRNDFVVSHPFEECLIWPSNIQARMRRHDGGCLSAMSSISSCEVFQGSAKVEPSKFLNSISTDTSGR